MSHDAIKAGRRHSASDAAIMKALRGDMQSYALKLMGDTDDFAVKMSDYLKALGYEDEDGDGEVTPDEAEAQALDKDEEEEDADEEAPATKALDLMAQAALVRRAVHEALETLNAGEMDAPEELGSMAPEGPPVPVLVYDAYAIACMEGADWQIPYTLAGGTVELETPDTWVRVEKEWAPIADAPPITGDAVKALDGGEITGYAIRFGDASEPDVSAMRDYFTKQTDFWLDAWQTRPMLYHHALDAATKSAPRIGEWTAAGVDDVGVWLRGQLDAAHKYYAAIKELARRGLLRISSDSAPHLVTREPQPGGANAVTRWPLMAASLTPTAAEPRLLPVALKTLLADLGLPIPAREEAPPEHDAQRHASAAADVSAVQRLALELDLLDLEYIPL